MCSFLLKNVNFCTNKTSYMRNCGDYNVPCGDEKLNKVLLKQK